MSNHAKSTGQASSVGSKRKTMEASGNETVNDATRKRAKPKLVESDSLELADGRLVTIQLRDLMKPICFTVCATSGLLLDTSHYLKSKQDDGTKIRVDKATLDQARNMIADLETMSTSIHKFFSISMVQNLVREHKEEIGGVDIAERSVIVDQVDSEPEKPFELRFQKWLLQEYWYNKHNQKVDGWFKSLQLPGHGDNFDTLAMLLFQKWDELSEEKRYELKKDFERIEFVRK